MYINKVCDKLIEMTRKEYISIFEKYLLNEAAEHDIEMLVDKIRDDEKINHFFETEISKMSSEMPQEVQHRLFSEIIEEIKVDNKPVIKPRLSINYKSVLKWTAVLILPVASALLMYVLMYNSNDRESSAGSPVTVSASNGEKAEVLLADGSKVWINSGSKLTYDNSYNKKQRKLMLDGEAFFEVAKNEHCPFIVVTNDMEVEALGTSFNINAYGEDAHFSSVLLDGKIKVHVLDQEFVLNSNERVVLHKKLNLVTKDTVNAADFVQWKSGNLYFRNSSFEEIANTLSRTFNVEIKFASEALKDVRFSGTLGNSSIRNSLDILSLTSAMRYEMDGTTIALHHK